MPDLRIENHGSLFLVRPDSDAGRKWLKDTAPEDAQFLGDAMAVEPRYIGLVIECAQADDLEVE